MRFHLTALILLISSTAFCQTPSQSAQPVRPYGTGSVFSHNDYLQPVPFYMAYLAGVGYVEADVFLQSKKLLVAHTKEEISEANSLEELYVRPLQAVIRRNRGFVFADTSKTLTFMIDLKSDAQSTLPALVALLKNYKELTTAKSLRITISGSMPTPDKWKQYPSYIYFDGRPNITYSNEQLLRVPLISDSFTNYSDWKGNTEMSEDQLSKIAAVRDAVHAKNKPLRLWGIPDGPNAWATSMKLGIDIINTDHPQDAVKYVSRYGKDNFELAGKQATYQPTKKFSTTAVPKNIILLIGDGTGLAQIYSGYTANHGSLNVFNMGTVGLSITKSSNGYITDSAAGATAFSTGRKTNNRFIGVDSVGTRLPTVAEHLKQKGYHISIASCGDITDATPASFYAHQRDRGMSEPIALDFMSTNFDVLIGAGAKSFVERTDKRNLFDELQRKGYTVSGQLSTLPAVDNTRFVIIDDAAGLRKSNGRGNFLTDSFKKASAMSVKSKQPFFMMFEGAQVDWGGHSNDLPYLATEFLDFDALVGEAVRFADQDGQTLVIVTADHETGGLSLVGGDIASGSVRSNFSTGGHTAIPVPVFAFGPGAHLFTGVYQNTQIYSKIMQLVGGK
ncbi:alkaline phosphatase [Chryseolinea sp. T2]|uniref:alkaline phosphatase n=1 Tax=Chryseolinea sp. T2 TaxID=3129255 RepID=UPI0030783504